jgi:biopolymer transport protein ExbD
MMMKLLRDPAPKARIDLVPMIDTIFSLLVFFMLAGLVVTHRYSIPVNLPGARGGAAEIRRVETLTIARDGRIFINREEVASAEEAVRRLLEQNGDNATLAVVINADREVRHGKVVELLDAIQQCGRAKVAIAIKHL